MRIDGDIRGRWRDMGVTGGMWGRWRDMGGIWRDMGVDGGRRLLYLGREGFIKETVSNEQFQD